METNRKPEIKGKRKWNVKPEKWVVGREEGGIKGKFAFRGGMGGRRTTTGGERNRVMDVG